ncbi:MAG TPA: lactonase family protein [Jiangellaceae bacterium]
MAVRGYLGRYGPDIGLLTGEAGALVVRPGPAATDPSYLAFSPAGFLYAAIESDKGGAVGAYAIDGDGLRPLGQRPTGGAGTCHVSVHPAGFVLSADYRSGTIAVHPIEADGSLGDRTDLVHHEGGGPDPDRQDSSHAHMVVTEPSGDYVLAVDLGTDTAYRYRLSDGRLRAVAQARVPAGAGPRHVAFHPAGRFGYIANELDSSVSVLDLASFTVGATVRTQPSDDPRPSAPSAIRVAADGRFCYVANRGPDTVAVLAISADGADLRLAATVPSGGEHPRDLVLAGGYMYVANQHSNTVTTFRTDTETGRPEPFGASLRTARPSCLLFPPAS